MQDWDRIIFYFDILFLLINSWFGNRYPKKIITVLTNYRRFIFVHKSCAMTHCVPLMWAGRRDSIIYRPFLGVYVFKNIIFSVIRRQYGFLTFFLLTCCRQALNICPTWTHLPTSTMETTLWCIGGVIFGHSSWKLQLKNNFSKSWFDQIPNYTIR